MTGLARKIIKGSAKVDQKKQEIKTLLSILDSVVPEEKWRNMADEEALHSFLVGRIPHYWKIVKFANGVGFKVCYHLPKQGEVCIFSSYAPDKISLNAETTPIMRNS